MLTAKDRGRLSKTGDGSLSLELNDSVWLFVSAPKTENRPLSLEKHPLCPGYTFRMMLQILDTCSVLSPG